MFVRGFNEEAEKWQCLGLQLLDQVSNHSNAQKTKTLINNNKFKFYVLKTESKTGTKNVEENKYKQCPNVELNAFQYNIHLYALYVYIGLSKPYPCFKQKDKRNKNDKMNYFSYNWEHNDWINNY